MALLEGKTALITGAASGIGRATALRMAQAGAALALIDRDPAGLEAVRDQAAGHGARVITETVDLTDPTATEQAIRRLWGELGGIDILHNCAGVLRLGPWERMSLDDYRFCMEVNYFGTLHCIQAVLPLMRGRGRGHIINMGSMAALRGLPNLGAYSASKFAVFGLSQALRDELHGTGISVSVVCPPSVRTPMVTDQAELPPIYRRFAWAEPEAVAGAIMRAIRSREFIVLVDLNTRALLWVQRLLPGLADYLMRTWSR